MHGVLLAQGERRDFGVEPFAVLRHHLIGALHNTERRRQGAAGGVLERFSRLHRRLLADNPGSTNFLDVTVRVVRGRVLVLACEDNLVRGASGVAVQNFNRMYGFDERTALL